MSITSALNNATSGLTANARMAEVVSSNLSNALTDGYGKRSVALSALQVAGGVRIDGINRFADKGIISDRRLSDAAIGINQRQTQALQSLSRTFGDIGDPASLAGRITALEQSLISAASDPASENRLAAVFQRLGDVTQTLRLQTNAVQDSRVQADAAIANDISTLNAALQQIEKLNADVSRLRGTGNDTSPILDARQQAIDKISGIMSLREIDRGNGQIALFTTGGETLIDGKAAQFVFRTTPTITADMTFESGALSGVSRSGIAINSSAGFGRLGGGTLEASFALRDSTMFEIQSDLDLIAKDLINRFANPAVDPTLNAGDAGLFTSNGAALIANEKDGLAGRLKINMNVDPASGGMLWRIRDGVQAITQGPVGRDSQINSWIDVLQKPFSLVMGAAAESVSDKVAVFQEKFGMMRLVSEEKTIFETVRWNTLRSAELSKGVDSDQELQQLLRIEQAYAANAKVIQTVDFMIQRLLEI